jgi:hypothetical protein
MGTSRGKRWYLGPVFADTELESRVNAVVPLTPRWNAPELRMANRGIRLATRAEKLAKQGKTARAARLLERLERLQEAYQTRTQP